MCQTVGDSVVTSGFQELYPILLLGVVVQYSLIQSLWLINRTEVPPNHQIQL